MFGRGSVFVLATALRAGRTGVRIPVVGVLLTLKHVEAGPGVQQAATSMRTGFFFPERKVAGA